MLLPWHKISDYLLIVFSLKMTNDGGFLFQLST